MATEEPWMGVREVAAHLRVRRESVYRWIEARGLPAHRIGRLLRFKLSEVDDWVRSSDGMAASNDKHSGVHDKDRKDADARK